MAGDNPVRAATAADAEDPVLRDRIWAVPFEDVWQAALALVSGGLRGWTLVHANDHDGFIEGTARGLGSARHDVRIDIMLDANAQTLVRAVVAAQKPGADFGRARRRLRRLMKALDARIANVPRPRPAGRSAS